MPKKSDVNSQRQRWNRIEDSLHRELPQLLSWLMNESDFGELRLKARDDGTTLAIAKGYGEDGGPVVCFGVGYGAVLALMAIESTITGNNWRLDKPWKGGTK